MLKGVKRYWWFYPYPQHAALEEKNIIFLKAKKFGGWGKVRKLVGILKWLLNFSNNNNWALKMSAWNLPKGKERKPPKNSISPNTTTSKTIWKMSDNGICPHRKFSKLCLQLPFTIINSIEISIWKPSEDKTGLGIRF